MIRKLSFSVIPTTYSRAIAAVALSAFAACRGPQSAIDPAGRGAEQIAELFWWMAGGAVIVWAAVVWLAVSAIRGQAGKSSEKQARLYIIGGGAIVPTLGER